MSGSSELKGPDLTRGVPAADVVERRPFLGHAHGEAVDISGFTLDDGTPAHSFSTLLADLAGIVRNTCRTPPAALRRARRAPLRPRAATLRTAAAAPPTRRDDGRDGC